MDFAKRLMNKYGWKEGEGLGKKGDGIAKPLKASMKFDQAGLGADPASDFNNHWWERVFNEAASNVQIKEEENSISMDLKDHDDSVEISTKGYSMKKLKKAKASAKGDEGRYQNFLQSSTLTKAGDEIENPDKIAVTDIEVTKYKVLTDEELFRACGGRTAHKGARHGLKLSGKLLRIEQQEREMLEKMQRDSEIKSSKEEAEEVSKKKKKKNKLKEREASEMPKSSEEPNEQEDENGTAEECNTSAKKKKKSAKRKAQEADDIAATTDKTPKKKKNKLQQDDNIEVKKKSKKSSKESVVPLEEVTSKPLKKKKKTKL